MVFLVALREKDWVFLNFARQLVNSFFGAGLGVGGLVVSVHRSKIFNVLVVFRKKATSLPGLDLELVALRALDLGSCHCCRLKVQA